MIQDANAIAAWRTPTPHRQTTCPPYNIPLLPPRPTLRGTALKAIDYVAPTTLADAITLLDRHGDRARLLAGGTDIIVQLREYLRDADVLVDVKHIAELNELTFDPRQGLRLGAAVPCYR